jgi:dienelactone hydrolase
MGIYTKDRALMKARARRATTRVKNPMVDAGKVALIGYCFGGMVGVDFGSTGVPLGAIVAIHGSFDGHPDGWAQNLKGKFLILHGAEDVPYPLPKVAEVLDELRKAKVDFELELYSGAGHGFSVPRNKDEERQHAVDRDHVALSQELFGIDQASADGAKRISPDVASAPSGLHTAADLLDDTFSDCKRHSDRSKDVACDGNPIALQLAHHFQDRFPVGALVDLTADVLWHFHGHLRSMALLLLVQPAKGA